LLLLLQVGGQGTITLLRLVQAPVCAPMTPVALDMGV
jgi:hypothetical protein